MIFRLKTGPAVEPISTTQAKNHLRQSSVDFADDLTPNQCIAPGSHAIAAAYSLKGTGVDVSGGDVLVLFNAGDCSAGTVDIKLQESDTDVDVDYSDVDDGAFAQVAAANDNQVFEKSYTGIKTYIRVVVTVAVGACSFSVDILLDSPNVSDGDYIDGLIAAAREHVENILNRKLITQTWYSYLNNFPGENDISLPFGSLQSIAAIKYTDTADNQSTLSTDYYSVDLYSLRGRAILKYGQSWPTDALSPNNPIEIEFVCGYGDTGADVPRSIRSAIKLIFHDLYVNRESKIIAPGLVSIENPTVNRLLNHYRLYSL